MSDDKRVPPFLCGGRILRISQGLSAVSSGKLTPMPDASKRTILRGGSRPSCGKAAKREYSRQPGFLKGTAAKKPGIGQ